MADSPNIKQSRKSPADFTGKTKERLQAQHELEVAEASKQMALATEQRAVEENQIVDYTGADKPIDEVEVSHDLEINEPEVVIRVNTDLQQMTFGKSIVKDAYEDENGVYHPTVYGPLRFFDFEAGRKYKVPRDLAIHLIQKEYADRY